MRLAVLVLLAATMLVAAGVDGVFHVEVQRTVRARAAEPPGELASRFASARDFSARNAILGLENHFNSYYTGLLTLGTSAQTYRVVFDTGSANFWVFGTEAALCREGAESTSFFNSRASPSFSTAGQTFGITYGTGTLAGYLGRETVDLGGTLRAQAADVLVVTDCFGFSTQEYDGLMGLGFPSLAVAGQTTVMSTLIARGLLTADEAVVGMYLTNSTTRSGEIAIGGVNTALFVPPLFYSPLVSADHWAVTLQSVRVGDLLLASGVSVLVDSGTTQLLMPQDVFDTLRTRIGTFTSNCALNRFDSMPTVTFTFAGQPFALTPRQYLVQVNGLCELGIGVLNGAPGGFGWILGDTFLRTVYTSYELSQRRVGFAPLAAGVF